MSITFQSLRQTLSAAFLGMLLAVPGLALANGPVDLNQADAATLAAALKGVGPAKAEAIVAYREEHGPFADVDELVNVKGIGLRTVDENRERMVVSSKPAARPQSKPATRAGS